MRARRPTTALTKILHPLTHTPSPSPTHPQSCCHSLTGEEGYDDDEMDTLAQALAEAAGDEGEEQGNLGMEGMDDEEDDGFDELEDGEVRCCRRSYSDWWS
jgi:hypothetical protein